MRRLERFFAGREPGGEVAVYLFGSMARGADQPDSDVDIGVLYRSDPPPTFDGLPLRLESELERLLGRATQVVTLNTAPADLRARVLRDGVLILDRDPSFRIRFEVRTRNEWFDLQPTLREYRRMGVRAV
ncbi:MAG: nucleotidyltransferase domain-containing protein [Acidobacteria bacterium]|nr:nucleotidyltransferase domain-containing protein [Acidobacteriota bacterium]